MKKSPENQREKKPRRLTLHRETIQLLEDPALLEAARGGTYEAARGQTTTVPITQCT